MASDRPPDPCKVEDLVKDVPAVQGLSRVQEAVSESFDGWLPQSNVLIRRRDGFRVVKLQIDTSSKDPNLILASDEIFRTPNFDFKELREACSNSMDSELKTKDKVSKTSNPSILGSKSAGDKVSKQNRKYGGSVRLSRRRSGIKRLTLSKTSSKLSDSDEFVDLDEVREFENQFVESELGRNVFVNAEFDQNQLNMGSNVHVDVAMDHNQTSGATSDGVLNQNQVKVNANAVDSVADLIQKNQQVASNIHSHVDSAQNQIPNPFLAMNSTKHDGVLGSDAITNADFGSAIDKTHSVSSAVSISACDAFVTAEGTVTADSNDIISQLNDHNMVDNVSAVHVAEPSGNYVDSNGTVHFVDKVTDIKGYVPTSYADLVKKSLNFMSGKGKLRFMAPIITDSGSKRAIIPDELVLKQSQEWSSTLYEYFVGKRLAFPTVQFHCNRLWKQFGLLDVILNEKGYYFFKFKSKEGMNAVLETGPWLINGVPIFLQAWKSSLFLSKPVPTRVPLWVNIFDLPLDTWDFEVLSYITSTIGVPISVDRYTAEMCEQKKGRAGFARVLIEVAVDFDLPSEIEALILENLVKFKVEYSWKPHRCSHCKIFGHDYDSCVARPKTVEELKTLDDVSAMKIGDLAAAPSTSTPFVQVQSKNRRKNKKGCQGAGQGAKDDGYVKKNDIKAPSHAQNQGTKIWGNVRYVPKVQTQQKEVNGNGKEKMDVDPPKLSNNAKVVTSNSFEALDGLNDQMDVSQADNVEWGKQLDEVDTYIRDKGKPTEDVLKTWTINQRDYFENRWEAHILDEMASKSSLNPSKPAYTNSAFRKDVEEVEVFIDAKKKPSKAVWKTWNSTKQIYFNTRWDSLVQEGTQGLVEESEEDVESDDTSSARFMKLDAA